MGAVNGRSHHPQILIRRGQIAYQHQQPRPGIGHGNDGYGETLMTVGYDKALIGHHFRRLIFNFTVSTNRHTHQPAHHVRRTLAYVRSPLGPFQKQQALRPVHAHRCP